MEMLEKQVKDLELASGGKQQGARGVVVSLPDAKAFAVPTAFRWIDVILPGRNLELSPHLGRAGRRSSLAPTQGPMLPRIPSLLPLLLPDSSEALPRQLGSHTITPTSRGA
jgi:hypothetical protein